MSEFEICNRGLHELTPENSHRSGIGVACLACKRQFRSSYEARVQEFREMVPEPLNDDWIEFAACKGEDGDEWFPTKKHPAIAKPSRVCQGCPVRKLCFSAGFFEPSGIYGGYTASARKAIFLGVRPMPKDML
jgi:hypothetical protein